MIIVEQLIHSFMQDYEQTYKKVKWYNEMKFIENKF